MSEELAKLRARIETWDEEKKTLAKLLCSLVESRGGDGAILAEAAALLWKLGYPCHP